MARVWLGTSGFSYKEWKGIFYPEDVPDRGMLPFYATRLNSVEIDSSFYRIPSHKTIQAWVDATPEDFRFGIKATQQITHRQRLKTPSGTLQYWIETVSLLGPRLGCVLYQLPPFFRCDLPRLEAFLSALPPLPAAFEFRHDSWFTDDTYALLERFRTGLCIQDVDERTSPIRITSGHTYVRLRRSAYSAQERDVWKNRLRGWAADGIEVFAFIKHEDNPGAPAIALDFAAGL